MKKIGKINFVITGSSYKYFNEFVYKENAFLRSTSSHDPLVIRPFSPSDIKKYFFPQSKYKHFEVMMIYMMTGGVTQYLDWLKDKDQGFLYCINSSFFKKGNPFRQEVDDLLKLEISENRLASATQILKAMKNKNFGLKELLTEINKNHQMSDNKLLSFLHDLIGLGFVGCKTLDGMIIDNPLLTEESFKRYYVSDLFLSFYFTVVEPHALNIEHNTKDNIFSALLDTSKKISNSDKVPVITEFTGNAFEMALIEVLKEKDLSLPIFQKMKLEDHNFTVNSYNKASKDQIDVYVIDNNYGKMKVIECKWISSFSKTASNYAKEVKEKSFHDENLSNITRENYYMFSIPVSTRNNQTFINEEVTTLFYKDLFK